MANLIDFYQVFIDLFDLFSRKWCSSTAELVASLSILRRVVHNKDTLADPPKAEFLEGGVRGGVGNHDVAVEVLAPLGQDLAALARHQGP